MKLLSLLTLVLSINFSNRTLAQENTSETFLEIGYKCDVLQNLAVIKNKKYKNSLEGIFEFYESGDLATNSITDIQRYHRKKLVELTLEYLTKAKPIGFYVSVNDLLIKKGIKTTLYTGKKFYFNSSSLNQNFFLYLDENKEWSLKCKFKAIVDTKNLFTKK